MGKRTKAASVLARKKQKLEEKKLNPFEIRVNRKKHHVLGQKSKSDRGLPGVSRSKAILKRRKTLLLEYKRRNKSNQFIDRRLGEYDEGLAPEERMMQRFVIEKQRKHERSSAYNLDEEEDLTHYGQSLGDMERFDDIQISEEEMEEEDIAETHFGGFLKKKSKQLHTGGESETPKTRKQVMEEIVVKSKAMKYERQSEKREIDNLMDKLDSEWKEMQKSIPSTKDTKDAAKSADSYDMVVRELAFERRGKPTDRLKSEEEMAKEEKERLEKLEAGRIQRMKGLSAADNMEHISADYISERPSIKKDERTVLYYKDGRMVLPEVDQLEDNSSHSETGSEASEVSVMEDSEESEEEEEDEEGEEEGEEDEEGVRKSSGGGESEEESVGEDPGGMYGSDLESDGDEEVDERDEDEEEEEDEDPDELLLENKENDEEEEEGEEGKREVSCAEDDIEMKEKAANELPYTFKVPGTLQEFRTIVDERTPEECLTAVERIHTCNHPSLSLENKFRLERFFGILVEYCLCLGEKPTSAGLTTLDKLARPLFKLAQIDPARTAAVFGGLLRGAHKRWKRRHNLYPPFSDILLFKLIGLLFPTSDHKHCVVTPAMLFMGQLLLKCHIRSARDLLYGLLVSQMLVEYISLSKRFVPEVVNFVTSVLGYFSRSKDCMLYPPFTTKSKLRNELSSREESADIDTLPEHPLSLLVTEGFSDGSSLITHQTKSTILKFALELALQLTELYAGLPSFPEIFAPITTSVLRLNSEGWPRQILVLCTRVVDGVSTHAAAPRPVLQLLKQKPKSIKFYEPKFDQVYEVGRKRARNKVTAERDKLKHKVKREMKGAVREIRKDNVFLAKEKLRETLERDAERERKTKQILHDLQTMQHEAKMERIRKNK